jgi:hypothetical protein
VRYLAYRVEDIPGNPGDAVTTWPSSLPGGPTLSLVAGHATLALDGARRIVRLSHDARFSSPAPVTVPAADVLASIVSTNTSRHALHWRDLTAPNEFLLAGTQAEPAAEYWPVAGQFLGMRLASTHRWAYQDVRLFTVRRTWPYTAAGRHALGFCGLFPPPLIYRETAQAPTAVIKPYTFAGHFFNDGFFAHARRALVEDATTSRVDRHAHVRALVAAEQVPYRGASCIGWTMQSDGWRAPTSRNSLTIVPNARWFAGARAVACLQTHPSLPPGEAIVGPPGWTQVARLHHGTTGGDGTQWGRFELWTKVLTGTEVGVPQTWQWTTLIFGAGLVVVVVSDEALLTPALRVVSLAPIGSTDSGVTQATVALTASRRWALAVPVVSFDGTYTTDVPNLSASPPWWQPNTGAPNLALVGVGDVRPHSVTWTMSAPVRGYAGMLELFYPDDPPFGGGGLKAGRMGILAAPRPRRRPGPG